MNETNNNEVKAIADALYNKSKRDFSHCERALKEQAEYFSPLYRDFILKLIKNNFLKIKNSGRGHLLPDYDKDDDYFSTNIDEKVVTRNDFSKRAKNLLLANIDELSCLPHELGHAVDFYFGYYASLTRNVALKNGKTLNEIFTEEFNNKKDELYAIVMDEYKNIINSNINDGAYDILVNNMVKYRELLSLDECSKDKIVLNKRKVIQQELYDVGFVETYYQLIGKKCFWILNNKYSPILDAMSSKYDFNGLFLAHHEIEYYNTGSLKAVEEFFANLFAATVTSNKTHLSYLSKYLPKSLEGFEILFQLFYDHIQNNKKFTDIPLKGKENENE